MHIATDPHSLPLGRRALARGCAVTIGNFDGVHQGHQQLISRATALARNAGRPAVIITFEPHPLRVLKGDQAPPQLISLQHKLECFADLGVDLALVMPFSKETAALSPEDFVKAVLVDCLNTRSLVVGYDYAFGKGRRGNAALLAALGLDLGFSVEEFPAVKVNGDIVSSTRIREALRAGRVEEAAELLGRAHSVEGVVVHGMNRGGRLLGFPTANLRLDDDLLLPCKGVYAVLAELDPKRHALPGVCSGSTGLYLRGVANVGDNPTFGDGFLRVETHLLDFHGEIYDKPFRVHFMQRLRDERKFNGVNELIEQIRLDADRARGILRNASKLAPGLAPDAVPDLAPGLAPSLAAPVEAENKAAPAAPGKGLRAPLAVLCLLLALAAPGLCLAADSLASDRQSAGYPASGITHEALVQRAAKSPLAAMELAQLGIDECNSDYFNQAVDLPSVVDKASAALLEVLRAQAGQAGQDGQDGLGQGGQALLLVMLAAADDNTLAMLKPLLTSEVRGLVNTGINGGYFAGRPNGTVRPAKGSLAAALEKMPPGRRQLVPGKVLSQEGDAAQVSAQFIDPKAGSFALLLALRHENGLWRVKEISNAKSLFTEAARRER